MMFVVDLIERIADRAEETIVRGDDGAVEIELDDGLRSADCAGPCDCIPRGRIIAPLQHRSSS
jgi:hypothetical protein